MRFAFILLILGCLGYAAYEKINGDQYQAGYEAGKKEILDQQAKEKQEADQKALQEKAQQTDQLQQQMAAMQHFIESLPDSLRRKYQAPVLPVRPIGNSGGEHGAGH